MVRFSPRMKIADLVEADYHLLAVLSRLGVEESFGEKTVEEICIRNGLDPDTLILICEVYSKNDYKPTEDILRRGHISDILRYIHLSHDYYVSNALVEMSGMIERLLEPCQKAQKQVVWKFFTDYEEELKKHFSLEEEKVIPYIQNLLIGLRSSVYSIDRFEENHSNIEEKISDLRSILMKSLPKECDTKLRNQVLMFIFELAHDLDRHTHIEDEVMVPMVRLIEDPHGYVEGPAGSVQEPDDERGELSDREKEILVSVAQGLLNKEIADKHSISVNTVITHRKNITRKTGIKTVAGLTVYAILNNLIDINSVE